MKKNKLHKIFIGEKILDLFKSYHLEPDAENIAYKYLKIEDESIIWEALENYKPLVIVSDILYPIFKIEGNLILNINGKIEIKRFEAIIDNDYKHLWESKIIKNRSESQLISND